MNSHPSQGLPPPLSNTFFKIIFLDETNEVSSYSIMTAMAAVVTPMRKQITQPPKVFVLALPS